MISLTCARKAREHVESDVRRRLLQHSNFACSICGKIPIVLHHIEEWSKRYSNDEELLIPICEPCHRRIHGEWGTLFSKEELYEYKAYPKRPLVLTDKLPLEKKKAYSFFVGSNFVAHGTRASLFGFSGGHNLLTVDTSTGSLMLTVLAEVQDERDVYLIKKNELMIDTNDIWDMRYSGSALRIWRIAGTGKRIFIDLVLKPDVVIIREMNTTFDDRPFRIYRFRRPQRRQLDRISRRVKQHEERFGELAVQIDQQPRIGEVFNGVDIDAAVKQHQKQLLKTRLEQELATWFRSEFNWDWPYFRWVFNQALAVSPVFARPREVPANVPEEFGQAYEMIVQIKSKYSEEFKLLEDTVVEYDGRVLINNIQA